MPKDIQLVSAGAGLGPRQFAKCGLSPSETRDRDRPTDAAQAHSRDPVNEAPQTEPRASLRL